MTPTAIDLTVTLTAEQVRAALSSLPVEDRCDPDCEGYSIFESDSNGIEVERCDSCCASIRAMGGPDLTDGDVAQLPEARAWLVETLNGAPAYACQCGWVGGAPVRFWGRPYCPPCHRHVGRRRVTEVDPTTLPPRPPKTPRKTVTVIVELEIEGAEDEAIEAVEASLDSGLFQDDLNGRGITVLSATNRSAD